MEINDRALFHSPVTSQRGKGGSAAGVTGKDTAVEAKAAPKAEKLEVADIEAAIQDLQKYMEGLGRDLSFRTDQTLERPIITVLDSNTKEVVRQIPSEEVVAIAKQIQSDLDELRAGILMKTSI